MKTAARDSCEVVVNRGRVAESGATGGNVTGLSLQTTDLVGKRLELSAGWRSWPMSAVPLACWRRARFRQPPASSGSRPPHQKSASRGYHACVRHAQEPRGSTLCRAQAAFDHQLDSHQQLGRRRATADDVRILGIRRAGGLMSYGANFPVPLRAAPPALSTRFCAAPRPDFANGKSRSRTPGSLTVPISRDQIGPIGQSSSTRSRIITMRRPAGNDPRFCAPILLNKSNPQWGVVACR